MNNPVIEITRTRNPFDGIAHYVDVPATLGEMLRLQVDTRPDGEAVVAVGGGRLFYGDLWDRASRACGGLRADGLEPGDRVAVRYPAGMNWVLAFWGAVLAGGIAVVVNTRSARPEVEFVLSDAGVKVDLAAD